MATDPFGARNMPLQTSKPHPGLLSDLTRSTDNADGTTDSTSTDNSTCGTRLMMMLARRGEGREIEEGRDGKGKGEREPETKRKGASAMIGRSIKPLPIYGYGIFYSYLCQASSFCLHCPSGHCSHCSRASVMERPHIRGVNWNAKR